jgi:hypothetical protein
LLRVFADSTAYRFLEAENGRSFLSALAFCLAPRPLGLGLDPIMVVLVDRATAPEASIASIQAQARELLQLIKRDTEMFRKEASDNEVLGALRENALGLQMMRRARMERDSDGGERVVRHVMWVFPESESAWDKDLSVEGWVAHVGYLQELAGVKGDRARIATSKPLYALSPRLELAFAR